jgi:hypothetical protein
MKLADALKVSLDELRMQMLGLQVLFGFQFQGLFQDNFVAVDLSGRLIDAAGLAFTIFALALMIAVCCQHRLVEAGEASQRIYRTSKAYAKVALLPLAASIGCNLFVAGEGIFGAQLAATLATLLFVIAILGWYILGIALRRHWAIEPREVPMKKSETPLHTKIEQMLTESRVILPGAQALLGFQFVAMLTKAFAQLPSTVRVFHLIALVSLAVSVVLLIAPAAIHRVTFQGNDDQRLHSTGSLLVTIALLPLAIGISCDLFVALSKLFGSGSLPIAAAVGAFTLLLSLWYIVPLALRFTYRSIGHPEAAGQR